MSLLEWDPGLSRIVEMGALEALGTLRLGRHSPWSASSRDTSQARQTPPTREKSCAHRRRFPPVSHAGRPWTRNFTWNPYFTPGVK